MHPRQHLIPDDHIETIKSLKTCIDSLPMGLPKTDDRTRYLFEIYNTYLNTTNRIEDINCSSCRGKVLMNIGMIYE